MERHIQVTSLISCILIKIGSENPALVIMARSRWNWKNWDLAIPGA